MRAAEPTRGLIRVFREGPEQRVSQTFPALVYFRLGLLCVGAGSFRVVVRFEVIRIDTDAGGETLLADLPFWGNRDRTFGKTLRGRVLP